MNKLKTYLLTHEFDGQISHSKFATEREVDVGTFFGDCDTEEIQWILDALSISFEPDRDETIMIEEDDIPVKYIS